MDNPILTIVTRHLANRSEAFARLKETINLWGNTFQHVVYVDKVGLGWLKCSQVLDEHKDDVDGHYVWILDDDDVCTCPNLPQILNRLKAKYDPDIILVRNLLMHPHKGTIIFPSDELWAEKKPDNFVIGSMGSSNVIVKNDVYKANIKYFATVDVREHDWYYLEALLKAVIGGRLSICWLDELVMRQSKSNRGG